ncbi:class I SAM-dependent methyltransferase [Flavobacterium jejuense]|uniref:Class I SAM-dependent methyltransferase n=1 Tax=Flavobacterium jejuense TaxID=1544455 RepID=A0ABX0IZM8_9FLAO|nr:class I SAM-dependent methyltransferase [Flavobacterium jejuense]NHN27446.1 class I SAM-dependent methyltransferase [Flavobacterium jejuense]
MKASFDIAAQNYDQSFTNTKIGKSQRNSVYKMLSKHLNTCTDILEINCGTGEDAIWLAQRNFNVLATDISENMIAIGKSKNHYQNLTFNQLDLTLLANRESLGTFDLVFSNFGGLNCLPKNELQNFFTNIPNHLNEKGKLALVIMPKNTIWEQCYFLLKGKLSKVFRRRKEVAIANVDGENVATYYYNPKDIVNLAKINFNFIESKPIGFFIPPSYLEPFFQNKIRLFKILNYLENKIKNKSFLSKYADHYIIILQKK